MDAISLCQMGAPRDVGSSAPYHHPRVGTSALCVLLGREAGGPPKGCATWCEGRGWVGVERERVPGMRLAGWG
jgi:hypothetical protein